MPYARWGWSSEVGVKPGQVLFPVLCPMDVVLSRSGGGGGAVVPVARIPGARAAPDVACVVDTVRPVPVITKPPHPALVAAPEPPAEHIDRRGGRIPVPREDPRPVRGLGAHNPEGHRTRRLPVSGWAMRAVVNVVAVVGLTPVRFHVRDRADQIVREPPLHRRPLEDLDGGAGEVTGDPA